MQIPFNEIYFNNDVTFATVYKKINELVKGDKFLAEIVDIKAETVTLKLNDGSTLQAKSLVLPEARIGERVAFAVKDNSDGVIQLEFVKSGDEDIPDNVVNSLLNKFEKPINRENQQVIKLMLKNDIPLSQENVDKAMFIKYSDSNITENKLLFLLEENIPLEKNTINVLNSIMDKSISMKNNIFELCEEIVTLKNTPIGDKLFKLLEIDKTLLKDIFSENKPNEIKFEDNKYHQNDDVKLKKLFEVVSDKLFIKLDDKENLTNTKKKLIQICDIVAKAKEITENNNESLHKVLNNIKKNIEFTNHISEYKNYIQIPFSLGGNYKQECELYVFKNPKGSKANADNASMLLGLDLAYLGRVEAYINKNYKNLNIQIKSDKESSLALMKKNFLKLDKALKEKGYAITSISFKKLEEPFDITKKNVEENKNENIKKKRFSFDMRI